MALKSAPPGPSDDQVAFRSIRFGWWLLGVSVTLGILVEMLHGFKVGWYLDVGNEMRRLMLTLAHTHGTWIAIVNMAAGYGAKTLGPTCLPAKPAAAIRIAGVLMPLGFFLGGLVIHDGDPGVGVFLVPIGGFLLLYGVFAVAAAVTRSRS